MHFFTGRSDFSTAIHESFHIWERTLHEAHRAVLATHFGDLSTVEAMEGAARAFERYLRTGRAPTAELTSVFAQAREWMREIYTRLMGTPLERRVHPEVRAVFDQMLGGTPTPSGVQPRRSGRPARSRARQTGPSRKRARSGLL